MMRPVYFACGLATAVVLIGVLFENGDPNPQCGGSDLPGEGSLPPLAGNPRPDRAATVAVALREPGRVLELKASLKPVEVLDETLVRVDRGAWKRRAVVRTVGHFGDLVVEDILDEAGNPDPERRVITSAEYVVVSAPEAEPLEMAERVCRRKGFDFVREYPHLPLAKVRVGGRSLEDFDGTLEKLKTALAGIPVHVEPDFLQTSALCAVPPNDPLFPGQWSLPKIGAPDAWEIPVEDTGEILVCVIDSGIDLDHPDLQANLWTNPGEIDGDRIDNDGNGFIDDVHGYNFAENYIDPDDPEDSDLFPPDDDLYHGSFCAGIIGAVADNAAGIAGICRRVNVKLVALKASEWDDVYGSDMALSMHYARMLHDDGHTVAAVNLSMGIHNGPAIIEALRDGVAALEAAGIPVCCSAGNNNNSTLGYPAKFTNSNIITMAASAPDDSPWKDGKYTGTNYHPTLVHLAAPGQDIESTVPDFFWGDENKDGYASGSGTSFATPMVTASCAVLKAINPDLTGLEIRQIILNTTRTLPEWEGMCLTSGVLDLAAAARSAMATRNFQVVSTQMQTDGNVRLDWHDLGEGWNYRVQLAPAPGGPWTPAPGTWPTQETRWTDSAATGQTQRFYRVEASPLTSQ